MFELGNCYLQGRGVTVNESLAFESFRRSAAAGNANAMWMLGNLYQSVEDYQVQGVWTRLADAAKAFESFRLAEPKAACWPVNLARCYLEGKGTTKDWAKAEQLLKKRRQVMTSTQCCYWRR